MRIIQQIMRKTLITARWVIRPALWIARIILLALVLFGCASSNAVTVESAWMLPAEQNGNGAVYFVIKNNTQQDDTLLSVSSDRAQSVEMHQTKQDANGVMSMVQQASVPIPANSTVAFKPGGYHVMMIGLDASLTAGDAFPITLNFKNAGGVSVQVTVKQP